MIELFASAIMHNPTTQDLFFIVKHAPVRAYAFELDLAWQCFRTAAWHSNAFRLGLAQQCSWIGLGTAMLLNWSCATRSLRELRALCSLSLLIRCTSNSNLSTCDLADDLARARYLVITTMLYNVSNPHDNPSDCYNINTAFAQILSVVGFCALILLCGWVHKVILRLRTCWSINRAFSYFTLDGETEEIDTWPTRLQRLERLHPSTVFVKWHESDKINHTHARRISSEHQVWWVTQFKISQRCLLTIIKV